MSTKPRKRELPRSGQLHEMRCLPGAGLFSISVANSVPMMRGNTSEAGRILAKSSSVNSGESSSGSSAPGVESIRSQSMSSIGFMAIHLTLIGFSETDDSDAILNWRKNQHHQAALQIACGLIAGFSILFSRVVGLFD